MEDYPKILKVWEKAYRACPYIAGFSSAAKIGLATAMYFDDNYSDNQVLLVFGMGIATGFLAYDIFKKVRETKPSGLEEKVG